MEEIQTFVDEALLMSSFRDENVLSMLGVSFDIYGQPLVILPYLGNGDLLSYLRTNNKVRTWAFVRVQQGNGRGEHLLNS